MRTAVFSRVIPTEFNGIFDDSVTLWVLKNSAEMLPSALSRTLLKDILAVVLLNSRKPVTVPATTFDNHADGWFPPMLEQPKNQHLSFVLVSLVELIHEQEAVVDPRKGSSFQNSTVLEYCTILQISRLECTDENGISKQRSWEKSE
jgi:hypothetical protein